jgi:hypothetical protein
MDKVPSEIEDDNSSDEDKIFFQKFFFFFSINLYSLIKRKRNIYSESKKKNT